ncbi:MAG: hypothetical protein JJD97_15760, partial [Gemmatimonadaceae bacterium]|nr:hypothetical protein [Gemmatimonadaceae bacterium]
MRCIVATPRGQPMRVSSRAIASVVRLHGDSAESAELLSRLARAEGAQWVAPTSDTSLQIISAAYRELARSCAVGCPPPHIVQRVLDKAALLETAERSGVPVHRSRAGARTSERAPSLRVGLGMLLAKGNVVTSVQHLRLSENPPASGVTVVARTEAVDPKLLAYATRVLRALEWEGAGMVEFRIDGATGESALVDVIGHFWSSLALEIAAGVDFPLYAWQLSQGITPAPPSSYPYGLRMRWTAGSLMRVGHVFAERREDRIPVGNALRQLLADFAPGTRSAMWSWDDPIPAIREAAVAEKRWMKDASKLALHAIVPSSLLGIVKDSRMLTAERRATYMKRRLLRTVGATRAVSLPQPVTSVLFVCHGNIMRSAAAAGFLKHELRAAGISGVR